MLADTKVRLDGTRVLAFEEICEDRLFSVPELQQRADQNLWDKDRRQYRVWLGNDEVAFLTFDIFWPDQLNLYEIFVASQHRGTGIGAGILRFAIALTKEMRKKRLTVRARPLSDQSQPELIQWYIRRGLTPTNDDPEFLEFVIQV